MRYVGRGIVALALLVVVAVVFVVLSSGGIAPPSGSPPSGSAITDVSASPGETAEPSPTVGPTDTPTSDGPSIAQLIGQKLVIRIDGPTPSAALLGRISRGEIGGVILFGANISTKAALVALIGALQGAATAGGQPPLMIAVDQEGGPIKRIPWAPPTMTVPAMGATGDPTIAQDQGTSTGAALLALGINVDLAPVADVPDSHASFMYKAQRTFSFDSTTTAQMAGAFASGLDLAGVLPAMKHFPGLGLARQDTDTSVVTIDASTDALDPGLDPYRSAIADDIPLIMLSNATYPAYDAVNAAGWSPVIANDLLRGDLGFTGVTITDSLAGTAKARHVSAGTLAVAAARAGTDMLLLSGSEAATAAIYTTLLSAAAQGSIPLATLQASYARILILKDSF